MPTLASTTPSWGDPSLPDRFWSKVYPEPNTGCWLWGATTSEGYGRFRVHGQTRLAHVVLYEALLGAIPGGWQIDHLCFVPWCVCPWHLGAVTPAENARRRSAHYRSDTSGYGHEFTEENTGYAKSRTGNLRRFCRPCRRRTEAARGPRQRKAVA